MLRHGRDNKLHIWAGVHLGGGTSSRRGGDKSSSGKAEEGEGGEEPARTLGGGSAALPGLATPVLLDTLDVNALNFCRFSLLELPSSAAAAADGREALLAVPNLVESAYVRRSVFLGWRWGRTDVQSCAGGRVDPPWEAAPPCGRREGGYTQRRGDGRAGRN